MPADNLITEYADTGSESAFRKLAERYSGMIYASALRRTGSHEASEEIVQNVFVALARKAKRLRAHPAIAAWLYRATMHESGTYVRRESKHRSKMKAYQAQTDETMTVDHTPETLPFLDEVIDKLSWSDRKLIMLRFFEGLSYREIASSLGKSEPASRKQAERALAKLGNLLRARGVAASCGVVAAALGTQLAKAAPDGIAKLAVNAKFVAEAGSVVSVPFGFALNRTAMKSLAAAVSFVAIMTVGILWMRSLEAKAPLRSESSLAQRSLLDAQDLSLGGKTHKRSDTSVKVEDSLNLTPAGICEAARSGNLDLIEAMLAAKPSLLDASNPHNWGYTPEMRQYPSARHPVEIAAVFGHSEMVARLLELSDNGESPFAGLYGTLKIGQKLGFSDVVDAVVSEILHRVDAHPEWVNFGDESGGTLLHYAADHSHIDLMKALLDRGAEADARKHDGTRAVHALAGDNAQTRLLIEYGIDYDLWVAAAMGDLARAQELLGEDPTLANTNFRPKGHHSSGLPLVVAAMNGHASMVQLLLDHGAHVDAKTPGKDYADEGLALIKATEHQHLGVVHLLLDHNADVDAWIDSSWGFKHLVRNSGDQALIDRVLTEKEKNPHVPSPSFKAWEGIVVGNIRDLPAPNPKDALDNISAAIVSQNRYGSYEDYREIITVMLEQGADQNARMNPTVEEMDAEHPKHWSRFGTPLHWLSTNYLKRKIYSTNPTLPTMEEILDLGELLLEHGANIEARHPITNHTPLSSAVEKGHLEYVTFLLENGASVHRQDPPETNPVEIAETLGLREIAEQLKRH